jgi:hypothetical protein
MSLAELVIVSVKVEGRSKSEVARDYKISRYWVQQLVKRYEAEGETAFVPCSRRPHTTDPDRWSAVVDGCSVLSGGTSGAPLSKAWPARESRFLARRCRNCHHLCCALFARPRSSRRR